MLSRLFSNYLKIIKNQRSQIVLNFILKIYNLLDKSNSIDIIFSTQNILSKKKSIGFDF